MNFHKIDLTDDNIEELATFYMTCFNAPDKGEDWTLETASQYIRDRAEENSDFLVITDNDGTLAGVSIGCPYNSASNSMDGNYNIPKGYYIAVLMISADYRGKGLGEQLLTYHTDHSKSANFHSILIRCRAENKPMRSLIEKSGFKSLDRYTSTLGGLSCERIIYIRTLA
jgi:ribosomal protein S18 acetylase RimI-like enzyme